MVKRLSTMRETQVQSLGGKSPWRRKWQSIPVLLPGKSHGQGSLVGYSPWGRKESDMTEGLHFHFQCRRCWIRGFDLWARKIPWRRKWQPTPVFLSGELHGQRNLVGYSPGGRKELTEWLSMTSTAEILNLGIRDLDLNHSSQIH